MTAFAPSQEAPRARTIAQSAQEYGRGVAGGLLFSIPLLFTAEVWSSSFTIEPLRLLLYVVCVSALLVLYNHFAGLRPNASWLECVVDAVEEMGVGLVLAAATLWLVGELDAPLAPLEALGKIVMEGMSVALGVSVGTAQLGQSSESDPDAETGFGAELAIAFCGAIVFVSNIAPTEEILLVAQGATPMKLLFIALLSLGLGGYILYFSEFRGASKTEDKMEVARGVISSYAVALVATALTMGFFGRFDGETLSTNISQTVVAGLAGAMGASAGRFLLQLNQGGGGGDDGDEQNEGDDKQDNKDE